MKNLIIALTLILASLTTGCMAAYEDPTVAVDNGSTDGQSDGQSEDPCNLPDRLVKNADGVSFHDNLLNVDCKAIHTAEYGLRCLPYYDSQDNTNPVMGDSDFPEAGPSGFTADSCNADAPMVYYVKSAMGKFPKFAFIFNADRTKIVEAMNLVQPKDATKKNPNTTEAVEMSVYQSNCSSQSLVLNANNYYDSLRVTDGIAQDKAQCTAKGLALFSDRFPK